MYIYTDYVSERSLRNVRRLFTNVVVERERKDELVRLFKTIHIFTKGVFLTEVVAYKRTKAHISCRSKLNTL